MTQTLYLLRHAKSVPWGYEDDHNRELGPRGIKHMKRLARWLPGNLEPPECVLCSTSMRTRLTLEPLIPAWPLDEDRITYTRDVYLASSGTLHNLAQDAFETANSVMLIGHNPGFEYMAYHFMDRATAQHIHKMATGTLGVFDFPDGYALDARNVHMRLWKTRKDLKEA